MPLPNISEIILASNNKGKCKEFEHMFALYKINTKIIPLESVFQEEIEETGTTFSENSALKANTIYQKTKKNVLADDSGFQIEALGGKPGVFSARFMQKFGSYEKTFSHLEQEMQTHGNKNASFVCVLTLIIDGKLVQTQGEVKGQIAFPPKGEKGFGYDPIFVPNYINNEKNDKALTFAQIPDEEKNAISHRALAFKELIAKLQNIQKDG